MTLIKTQHNRRSFLKLSSAAGGGMVLGFSWLAGCKPAATENISLPSVIKEIEIPKEWFDFNAFLKIGENGIVTILSPNPEIGQNVKTSMPMLVAEELDVDWDNVIVEQAPLDTKKYTRQLAGGSQSIAKGWDSLRMAGATARRLLIEAAAKKWNVSADEITTEAGVLHHKASGKSIGYGEIATEATGLEIPSEVKLKDPKDFKIIGTSRKNVDGPQIVTGQPLFGIDIQKEGMLYATVLHAPAFGMKLKSFNADEAKSMPGIKDVFKINATPDGYEKQWCDVNAFDELIAIVGNSTWEVFNAKKTIKAKWVEDSKSENSADHDNLMSELLKKPVKEAARKDGDPAKAFKEADKVVERTYEAPFLPHNTLEPMNFYANVTGDKAELEGPIQTPEFLQKTVSSVLGIPLENVSIMMTRMGGGFGRRLYGHFVTEAALISQKMQTPIKLIYTREEDMTQGTYRPAYKITYRAAIDKENNITGITLKAVGMNDDLVVWTKDRFPAGAVDNYLVESHQQESNISVGAWRAPKSNFIAYAEQAFLDEVAETVGKDPIDMRLELFDRALKNPVGEKQDYEAERYAGVLKLVREKSNWENPPAGVHRGVSAYFCHNSYVAQVVDVVMDKARPKIQKVYCAVDCGIVVNPDAAINLIEGGIIDGIGHSMYSALSFKDGQAEQSNFDKLRLIRHSEAPEIETYFVDNGIAPTGLGEPTLPPIAAAVANAIYKATGERVYSQPFVKQKPLLG